MSTFDCIHLQCSQEYFWAPKLSPLACPNAFLRTLLERKLVSVQLWCMTETVHLDLLTAFLEVLGETSPLLLASVGQLMSTVAYKVSGNTETLGTSAFAPFVKAHHKVVHLCRPTCRSLPVKNSQNMQRYSDRFGGTYKNDSSMKSQERALTGRQSDRTLFGQKVVVIVQIQCMSPPLPLPPPQETLYGKPVATWKKNTLFNDVHIFLDNNS